MSDPETWAAKVARARKVIDTPHNGWGPVDPMVWAKDIEAAQAEIDRDDWMPIGAAPLNCSVVDIWIQSRDRGSYRVADCYWNEGWRMPSGAELPNAAHATHWRFPSHGPKSSPPQPRPMVESAPIDPNKPDEAIQMVRFDLTGAVFYGKARVEVGTTALMTVVGLATEAMNGRKEDAARRSAKMAPPPTEVAEKLPLRRPEEIAAMLANLGKMSEAGMSVREAMAVASLGHAYNDFIRLEVLHPSDQREFEAGIHALQNMILARFTVRAMKAAVE
jgi:hypothetical protein